MYYFLIPKLFDPRSEKGSGGGISNIRLILQLARTETVVVVPVIRSGVPRDFRAHPRIWVHGPHTHSVGRLAFLLQRYGAFGRRVRRVVSTHGDGRLLATRSTIPLALALSQEKGYPLDIVTRAFEDHEQAGVRSVSDRQSLFHRLDGLLNRRKIVRAYRRADRIIVNSRFMAAETRSLFQTKSEFLVHYPELDIPRREPGDGRIETVGFVNKGARKGKALIQELARELPSLRFAIFGEPLSEVGHLPNILNRGYIHDRCELFDAADLFLMPSVWDEPYGRVAAEAIWRGKPALVSNRGGLPEAAPVSDFRVNGTDPLEWSAAVRRICQDPLRVKAQVLAAQGALSRAREEQCDASALTRLHQGVQG